MAHTGIFGGTFNPIHNGHLHLLQEADAALSFDRILVIPANIRLAAAGMDKVFVSDIELKAKGKSYTILTMERLHALFPGDRFTLLMGADMLLTFDQWYRWQDILRLADLAAFARNDGEEAALLQKAAELPGARVIRTEPLPLSSTRVRETLMSGGDASAMVPEAVFRYIKRRRLYEPPLPAPEGRL